MKLLLLAFAFSLAHAQAPTAPDSLPDCPPAPKAPGGQSNQSQKQAEMQPTVYDDGYSCPGGCKEPHVVFHAVHNGTPNAYDPELSQFKDKLKKQPLKLERCRKGHKCEICFRDNTDCLLIKYEGSGPPPGKFDFPVAFYASNCHRKDIPERLRRECSDILAARARYANRINCFHERAHPSCAYLMQRREEELQNDTGTYQRCKSMGVDAYNRSAPEGKKRKYDCAYSEAKMRFPSKANGVACARSWHTLLPGACPPGSYVGRFGLNCCRADNFWAAALGSDCAEFFPVPTPEAP